MKGIDIQQTMVTTFGGDSKNKKGGKSMTSVDLQHYVNLTGFRNLNSYAFKTNPISGLRSVIINIDSKTVIRGGEQKRSTSGISPSKQSSLSTSSVDKATRPYSFSASSSSSISPSTTDMRNASLEQLPSSRSSSASSTVASSSASALLVPAAAPVPSDATVKPEIAVNTLRNSTIAAATGNEIINEIHPLSQSLYDTIMHSSLTMKNIDLLIEVERLCLILGGIRVTFCKSGKDRTGMAVTLEQARQLGERFNCGMSSSRLLKDANLMRVHGCRLMIAEKNIGKSVYSINILQAQFLPEMFRPPTSVCEAVLKKDNS
jgi:hypothetical protein